MSAADRIKGLLRDLIREELASLTFRGIYEYRIGSTPGNAMHADPTDATLGLPSITDVATVPSPLGETVTYQEGALVYVGFINASPQRPVILHGDPGTLANTVAIDAGQATDTNAIQLGAASATVIRSGDTVSFAGFGPSPITLAPGVPPVISKVKA